MATLSAGAMTYSQWALRHDPTGKISALVNLLSQTNEFWDDFLSVECQSGNAFEFTQVVSLPSGTRRQYNQGVGATLAGVAKQVQVCSEYADWSVLDASLAELGGNLSALRAQEDALHMQGLSQQISSDIFYSNRATDPSAFNGLANIYSTVNAATSLIAGNVIDGLGTGSDNCSMWLVTWGPKQIHGIYPKGSTAGLTHRDMGYLPKLDTQTPALEYPAYRTYLNWKIGMAVHDWRFAVRLCNIDVSDLNTASPANLINGMVKMVHRLPVAPVGVSTEQKADATMDTVEMGRSAFYCNRTLRTYLDLQAMNKTNVLLQLQEWNGKTITTFRGVPIRTCDALTNAEARVV